MAGPGQDAKSLLCNFCQRFTKRSIGKNDIVYTTQSFGTVGTQFQSTVMLACIEGLQYAGATASNKKEAEQNAALIALQNHAEQIANLPEPTPGQGKKRKAHDAGLGSVPAILTGASHIPASGAAALPATGQYKMALNVALGRILRRPQLKEDTIFQSAQTVGGWQATLSMPGLPGQWATLAWAGEVGPSEKEAQENACEQAMAAIQADPSFQQQMAAPPKAQTRNLAKGKGKGFGKGMGKGKGKGKGGCDGGFGGGFGAGFGAGFDGGMGMGGVGMGGMGMGGMGGMGTGGLRMGTGGFCMGTGGF